MNNITFSLGKSFLITLIKKYFVEIYNFTFEKSKNKSDKLRTIIF